MAKESPYFSRSKSGYVRDFNTVDVFAFNVMGLALGLALSTNPAFIGSFAPSAHIVWVLVLGAAMAFVNGLNYGWFGAIMPSTGGDYVFVTRSLNHRLGFLTSWGFTACQIYGLSINLGWILSVGIMPALVTLGISTNQPQIVKLGASLGDPLIMAVGSLLLVAIYFLLAYLEVGLNRIVIYSLFACGLLGPALMWWVFHTHDNAAFIADFNSFMQRFNSTPDAYALAIQTAQQNGMVVKSPNFWTSLQGVPLGFLCFIGFTYSVYVGGEVREPAKSQVRGILGAWALSFVIFWVCMWQYVGVVGQEFHSAIGFPAVGEKLGLPGNSMNFIAGAISGHPILNILMQVGTLMWFLLVPYVILQVATHNVVAWTCDRLLPDRFLSRAGRTNAAWFALLAVCLAAVVCVMANYLFGFTLVGAVALAAVAFLLTGIAAFYLPTHQPEWFKNAPPIAQFRFLGSTLFQVVGLISALGFAGILYASVKYSAISGGTRTRVLAVLAVVYLTGLVVYELGTSKLRRQVAAKGVNLDALFDEIPAD